MSGSADAPVRIIVIGDQYAAGFGDPKALGWTGRVAARTLPQREIEVVTLAVPGETTSQMSDRWFAEFERRRATDIETRLVVALGPADIEHGLSLARSRLNLANILDVAIEKSLNPLVVGPPPVLSQNEAKLGELSTAFHDVAGRRRTPFVELFSPLQYHEQWLGDLAASGNRLPQQAGYGLIAWLVLHYGWRTWLGLPNDG
ncbi:GDSL-type esterase/lipase family protein [Rarobacter incanus]|uniref:GDSL-like lipase/acylhydrolase family protein n=1 Tax=Rarobacter incanus TaxID=153494 RepID=A0A542SRE0_9MICO|nr:GDSL-type esterase/lipase family protein [Rarobacter incanus]TQK77164.1 GDSL-like lipase/acylhydrolase family protein [Rarobacter incanus]